MKIYVANHLDLDDGVWRIAGVYTRRSLAEQRIARLTVRSATLKDSIKPERQRAEGGTAP